MGKPDGLRTHLRWDGQQYYIYALVDPRNDEIRYIGMSKDVEYRYYRHLTTPCSANTLHWLYELRQLGLWPIMQILEIINRQNNQSFKSFRLAAHEREAYWIEKYLQMDVPLLNIPGQTRKYLTDNSHLEKMRLEDIIAPDTRFKSAVTPRTNEKIFLSSLDTLMKEALMTQKQVADETKLSPGTVSRMANGHSTSRLSVRKVLTLLSQKLGRKIEIQDVEGLNITDD